MDPDQFTNEKTGRFLKAPEGFWTFVPAPLPPQLAYTGKLVAALSKADAALSELAGLGRALPNPHLLIAPYVRREAVLSSRIEGTRADINDLLLEELAMPDAGEEALPFLRPQGFDAEDLREVRNYVLALEYGMERRKELPLSLRLIRELHERLLAGVRGNSATPGEFRRSQNWIGASGSTPSTATYVPPPVAEMMECLSDWERFVHSDSELPDLIQCALMHEQFEAIHPFLDGNGRVGRLLITLFLIERGRLDQPLLYLSEYIESHRQDYYESLQRVRTHGDWEGWLLYFLDGVAVTARGGILQARALLDLRETLRERFVSRPRVVQLIDPLFANPYVTAARVEKLLGVSAPTARQVISILEAGEVLVETTGRVWGKIYGARPILEALQRPTAPAEK